MSETPMLSNMTRTSLLVPDQIKAAAVAITRCRVPFYESSKDPCGGPQLGDGGTYNAVGSFRTPEVFLWLCRAGLTTVLRHIEHALQRATDGLQAAREVQKFFLSHPKAREVGLENFDPGSEAARLFADLLDDCNLGDAVSMDRRTAMNLHDERHEGVMQLTEARTALLNAISTGSPCHVS